jgi:ABC-2 type transport system permease protein
LARGGGVVNWQQLGAVVWLRWRLLVNQWRKAGAFTVALMVIVTVGALVTAIPLFIGSFMLGQYAIPKAAPAHLMYVWDGLIVAFLFFWSVGVVAELQRTEPLSLVKFMHLPVSITGAFLINYLSSLLRLSLIFFGPIMLGFSLALVFVKGIVFAPVFLLLAAFFLMVTALTYQLQGWLASLMSNPRRRRTVVVATTAIFVLIVQLPNLINFFAPWGPRQQLVRSAKFQDETAKIKHAYEAGEFDAHEFLRRTQEAMEAQKHAMQQEDRASLKEWEQKADLANVILPIGWLPLGVKAAAEGRIMPSILGLLGMGLIGIASLYRAYGTTIDMYQGQSSNPRGRPTPVRAVAQPAAARKARTLLLESRLPGLSEPASAIALSGLRSLVRSPEAKMMLLTPVIMIPIFGSMLWRGRDNIPESVRPLVAFGGMLFVLLGMVQMMTNQFGFDRDGFRVFVLSPASRRDILLGKNLAFAPMTLGMAAIVLVVVQILCPMRLDHFLTMLPQYLSMFLVFCILSNLVSIYAPAHVAAGSLRPANPKLTTILLQTVMIGMIFPLTQAVILMPLGIEFLLKYFGWGGGVPIFLVLSIVECALVVLIYYLSLIWQGELLQGREQRILECVTNRAA